VFTVYLDDDVFINVDDVTSSVTEAERSSRYWEPLYRIQSTPPSKNNISTPLLLRYFWHLKLYRRQVNAELIQKINYYCRRCSRFSLSV